MPVLHRNELRISNSDGLSLSMREVRLQDASRVPLILVHGARVPGIPSFDLPVEGGSLAADLALAGHPVYILDLRGYGRSERPQAMNQPPERDRTLVRVNEAARDIGAAVAWVSRQLDQQVALLGWATGGMWCGYYATQWPERVSDLILYNALYQSPGHPSLGLGSNLEDSERPGTFNYDSIGSYRFNVAGGLLGVWDASISVDDKHAWRDPEVAAAYVGEALASDDSSEEREPPSFRAPAGALEDSFYQASGRQLWDASLVRARTLVVAGERDFWSQAVDRELLAAHLTNAREVRIDVIPDATHFVHLDRPTAGRAAFLSTVLDFLAGSTSDA